MEKTAKRLKRLKPGTRLKAYLASTGHIESIQPGRNLTIRDTGALEELPALNPVEDIITRALYPRIEEAQTVILPSIPPHLKAAYKKAIQNTPRIYEHRAERGDSSLSLIYQTIILCQKYQGALPDCIYVASQTERALIEESPTYTGAAWTGEFYFSRGRKEIEAIPVFPDSLLPDILKYALDGRVPEHYAIALIEQ